MPITGGGRGEPPLPWPASASAIVGSTESGQHLLRIVGYSGTKDAVPTGRDIRSRSFRVGGHSWHIRYYPNGSNSTCSDYISVFLKLDHHHNNVVDEDPLGVRARFTFSLLDDGGKPVPCYTMATEHTFRDEDWGHECFISREDLETSEHLKDDRFSIRCDLTVVTSKEIRTMDVDVDDTAGAIMSQVVVLPSDLHRHLAGLLATGEGADVTFLVDTRTFAAHRCVLMARSPVFHAELSLSLSSSSLPPPPPTTADNNSGAAATAVVEIQDMEADDFEAFLHYVYTDTLPAEKAAATLPDLVAAANRYQMERLRLVCEDKLAELVDVATVVAILAFAVEHHCLGLKEACLRFLEDPANLREVVVNTDCLEQLSRNCPSVFKDVIAKLADAAQESCS